MAEAGNGAGEDADDFIAQRLRASDGFRRKPVTEPVMPSPHFAAGCAGDCEKLDQLAGAFATKAFLDIGADGVRRSDLLADEFPAFRQLSQRHHILHHQVEQFVRLLVSSKLFQFLLTHISVAGTTLASRHSSLALPEELLLQDVVAFADAVAGGAYFGAIEN